MKKFFALFAAVALALTAFAENINPNQVPNSLRQFVTTHYGKNVTITKAERDRKSGGYEYEIKLSNGVEIDYGISEEWLEVEDINGVPTAIVGEEITTHVTNTYPGTKVVKIERKHPGFEVKLSDGKELIYDRSGKFVRHDK